MILSAIKYHWRYSLLMVGLSMTCPSLFSQHTGPVDSVNPPESPSDHIFVKVEQEVGFPGGNKAFGNYISKQFDAGKLNAVLPDSLTGFLDSVAVSLVIKKDGTLKDIRPKGGFSPVFRAEVTRVLLASGTWKPAMACGFYVNAYRSYVFYYSRNADMQSVSVRECTTDEVKNFPAENP